MSKIKNTLKVNYVNFEASDSVTNYLEKKLTKHESETKDIISLTCKLQMDSSRAGKTYAISLEVDLPHSGFVVREKGNDLYQVIDQISDKYRSRIVKFYDKLNDAHTNKASVREIDSDERNIGVADDMAEYTFMMNETPQYSIVERKYFFDNSPLHVEEAIEMMEMMNRPCFLFKNIDNGKYSVVYRINSKSSKKGYGIIEPK